MKKIIVMMLITISVQIFCKENANTLMSKTCNYVNLPDVLVGRVITKLEQENKTDDIFCDGEGLKMAYYLVEDNEYNLNVGVVLNIKNQMTYEEINEFKKDFQNKLYAYNTFFKTLNKENLGRIPLPDKEVIRFYGKIENIDDKFLVIAKYEYDRKKNKYEMYANSKSYGELNRIGLFGDMDVKISDEVIY